MLVQDYRSTRRCELDRYSRPAYSVAKNAFLAVKRISDDLNLEFEMLFVLRGLLSILVVAASSVAADLPKARWIQNGIIDAGGSHEPLIFLTRTGGMQMDARQMLEHAQSEEVLRRLKDQGVEVFHTHLYKGFGMAAEKPDMEKTRHAAEIAHRLELKVDTYIQWNSLMYETFFAEEPRAKDWVQRDASGQPILLTYDYEQSFRYRPCFANPEYLEYLKRVVQYAVAEVKTDFIHFDNFDLNPEPESCHCPYCVRGFRRRLEAKYPPEVRRERFGFDNMEFVQPPLWNAGNKPENMTFIRDPMIQEWIDFRCQVMADALHEVAAYAKSLNPEVVIEVNPHGITGANRAFEAGLDHARFLKDTEVFWTEEENDPGYLEDGRLVSKIRSYKLARAFNNILFTYTSESDLAMAECLAFNQTIGFAGSDPLSAGMLKYISFYRKHRELYTGAKDVAPVAVLRSYPSIAYHNAKAQLAAVLTEQALIQARVPFSLVFDELLPDLSNYKVLVLPDSECLSDAQLSAVHAFVARGGGLVAIGQAGFYDDWRRHRVKPGLADMISYRAVDGDGGDVAEPLGPLRAEYLRGRVAYIPEVRFDGSLPPREPFFAIGNRFWKRPANAEQIVDAIRWASRDALGVQVSGPDSLVMNLVSQPDRELLHLVNYQAQSNATIDPLDVELRVPAGKVVKSVTVISADRDEVQALPFEQREPGTIRCKVPGVRVYSVMVVSY